MGANYREMPAKERFCQEHGVNLGSFFRWQRQYRRFGIKGLVTKYGNRDRGARRKSSWNIESVIEINPKRPLASLQQILDVIRASPEIPPEQATKAVRYLEKELELLKAQKRRSLPRPLTEDERQRLVNYRAGTHKNHRAKAVALLMAEEGKSMEEISKAAGVTPTSIYRWLRLFREKGVDFIETKVDAVGHQKLWEQRTIRLFELLHAPPAAFGVNRTTWTHQAIMEAYLRTHGESLPSGAIKRIIKKSGYAWRRARMVLTSPDPEYKEKIAKVLGVLRGLQGDECFFFIDEAGPWRVKKYGGRALAGKGTVNTIPKHQRSKGSIQFIIALEAATNQVTLAFTSNRKAPVVLSFLNELVRKYQSLSKLYLTWDALSMHSSGAINAWITQNNQRSEETGAVPLVEVVPLPAKAQFLNVVESVISGLKRAVIVNSDYPSAEAMQAAIYKHFEARNRYYLDNPKRAGNKIWDAALFDADSLPGGLFRKM